MDDMKTLIIQRRIAHYRISFYTKLAKEISISLATTDSSGTFDESGFFKHYKIKGFFPFKTRKSLGFLFFRNAIKKIKPDTVIVEFDPNILNLFMLIIYRFRFNFKLILWTHGYSSKRDSFKPKKNIIDLYRLIWYKISDSIFVYQRKGYDVISKFSLKNKVQIINNTLDSELIIKQRNQLDQVGTSKVKKRLGLNYKNIILFVGRMVKRKRPLELLLLLEDILATNDNLLLLFIGDGPERKKISEIVTLKKYHNVITTGQINDLKTVNQYIFISDFVVVPGHIGLVANHCILMKKPLFTIKREKFNSSHAPEFNYLIHRRNSIISNDLNDLKRNIIDNLNDIKKYNYEFDSTIKNIKLESMVNNFVGGIRNLYE